MTETTRRREATRQRLVDAAITEFAARGIDATSVEQLCEAAGFTRGAFYSNFDSWDDLYLGVMGRESERVRRVGDQALAALADQLAPGCSGDPIQLGVQAFVDAVGHDAGHVLALVDLRLYAVRNPALRRGFLEVHAQSERLLQDLLRQVAAVTGRHLTMEPALVIATLSAVYEVVGTTCVASGEEFGPRVTQVLSDLLRGVLLPAPQGHPGN